MANRPTGLSLATRGRLPGRNLGLGLRGLLSLVADADPPTPPDPTCHFVSRTGSSGAFGSTTGTTGRMRAATASAGRTGSTTTC